MSPEEPRGSGGGLTRRSLLRLSAGAALLAAGGWLLKGIFFPRRLDRDEAATFEAFLDTLLADGEPPHRRDTALGPRLVAESEAKRRGRRALVEGVALLDRGARARGAATFRALPGPDREALVAELATAPTGSLAHYFYRTVRDRAFELYYADPRAAAPLGPPHPPQPHGYLDYEQAPARGRDG